MEEVKITKKKRDSVGRGLHWFYLLFLLISMGLIVRLVYLIFVFKPDPVVESMLTPSSTEVPIEPKRGSILASDGRVLAMSFTCYDLYMDCTVRKDAYAQMEDGAEREKEWLAKANELAKGLSEILGDKSAADYYNLIRNGRAQGRKYVNICRGVDEGTYRRIAALPLYNEGRYAGGLIDDEKYIVRKYPYGTLARRTVGFVRRNESVRNSRVGIEGRYDHILHGEEGVEYLRTTDLGRVRDYAQEYRLAKDGQDVRTTLNIDIQDVAERALRSQIEEDPELEGGCTIVMEVKTGAIRAMVNLLRDSVSLKMEESMNLAIGRLGEPGSVFKAVNLMSNLEDGKVKSLDETLPTNHGLFPPFAQDHYITSYEARSHSNVISLVEGFSISSNYVFRKLASDNYRDNPQSYIDKIYMYKLGEAFDFDLEGLAKPNVPDPKSAAWSGTDLASVAIGYSISETPLHIVTFYNAIANKGRMMKPYLVEDIEEGGVVVEKMGPSVLNASICSKATADTITRALRAVVEYDHGTGSRLKNKNYSFAGKTGTARVALNGGGYERGGLKKHQGTFVGFFPAEDPKYTIITVVYSNLTYANTYGGTKPAAVVREIADYIYAMDPIWEEQVSRSGKMPEMKAQLPAVEEGKVPDVTGLGLKDALFVLENAGYVCSYSGYGHVVSQVNEGNKVTITLK